MFIGLGTSSHTQSWIELLENSELNVRLFAIPGGQPPLNWLIPTYISQVKGKNNKIREYLHDGNNSFFSRIFIKVAKKLGYPLFTPSKWLAKIIREWKPDIIHTLGLFDEQGGEYYLKVRKEFKLEHIGKWVLQLRGGSDMTLRHNLPECQPMLTRALTECDYLICDNYKNIDYCEEFGVPRSKFAPFVPVPGSGGMKISNNSVSRQVIPSKRERIILWPKAYDCIWSKGVPVIAAIQSAWERIYPCEIYMLAISPEIYQWFYTLPLKIREHVHIFDRIPRQDALLLMKRARIMLAPSLVDGVPNSLYEAMAYGAFPIVSPLETIIPIVKQEENVLFARNIYPDEISDTLIRAMNEDELVDRAAVKNFELVAKLVDRELISQKVVEFYKSIT